MDLKRAMLLRLARQNTELYPSDPIKREKVYNKYKVGRMCSLTKFIRKLLPRFYLFLLIVFSFLFLFAWAAVWDSRGGGRVGGIESGGSCRETKTAGTQGKTHACPKFYLRISKLYIFLMLRSLLLSLQEPEPLFKVYVDKLVEELRIQKLSEPLVIEKKWEQKAESLTSNWSRCTNQASPEGGDSLQVLNRLWTSEELLHVAQLSRWNEVVVEEMWITVTVIFLCYFLHLRSLKQTNDEGWGEKLPKELWCNFRLYTEFQTIKYPFIVFQLTLFLLLFHMLYIQYMLNRFTGNKFRNLGLFWEGKTS